MANESNEDYHLFKIVLIGDSGVGKSNILSQYMHAKFDPASKSTIGVEFATKTVEHGNKKYKLQIWDTAGQERYRAITNAFYRGAAGAIAVFDLTRKESLTNIDSWLQSVIQHADKEVVTVLIGNKSDLSQDRQVSTEEGMEFAKARKMSYVETSALSGKGIQDAFFCLLTGSLPQPALEQTDPLSNSLLGNLNKNTELSKSTTRLIIDDGWTPPPVRKDAVCFC